MLCCAVLCCAVLCCAVLCCAVQLICAMCSNAIDELETAWSQKTKSSFVSKTPPAKIRYHYRAQIVRNE
jgi:hypothetical protein